MSTETTAPIDPEGYATTAAAIEAEVGRVIVGQQALVRSVLVALLCEGHELFVGFLQQFLRHRGTPVPGL